MSAENLVAILLEEDNDSNDEVSTKDFARPVDTLRLCIEKRPETNYGERTGETEFRCNLTTLTPKSLAYVVGTGYTAWDALTDFKNKANANGYDVRGANIVIDYQVDRTGATVRSGAGTSLFSI